MVLMKPSPETFPSVNFRMTWILPDPEPGILVYSHEVTSVSTILMCPLKGKRKPPTAPGCRSPPVGFAGGKNSLFLKFTRRVSQIAVSCTYSVPQYATLSDDLRVKGARYDPERTMGQ